VLVLNNVPPDFVRISSGLGEARPASVIILPALFEDDVKAVIELAGLARPRQREPARREPDATRCAPSRKWRPP
jgi:hypothetical protein